MQINNVSIPVSLPKETPVREDQASKVTTENVQDVQSQALEEFGMKEPNHHENIAEKQWDKVVEKANKALEGVQTTLEFKFHKATHEMVVKVLDKETKEIIREIPPEKFLDLVAKIWELAGLFVDERR